MPKLRGFCAVVEVTIALGALVSRSGTALAADVPPLVVELKYEVDPALSGCPSDAEFRRAVSDQLHYDPFRGEATRRVSAQVRRLETGLEAHATWSDPAGKKQGERQLASTNRDCGELVRGLAFAIAVQIQLLNASASVDAATNEDKRNGDDKRPTDDKRAPEAPVGPPAPPPAAARPSDVPAAPPPSTVGSNHAEPHVVLGIGPRADVGLSPAISAGAQAFVGIRHGWLGLELAAFASLPTKLRQPDDTGFSMSTFGATIAPCARTEELSLCALGLVGRMHVEGFGVDETRSPSSTFVKAGARVGGEQRLGRGIGARVYADGLATLTRRTVWLNGLDVWTTPIVAAGAGFDVYVLFP